MPTFELLLDPWDIEYGGDFHFEGASTSGADDLDVEVEVAFHAWTPIVPRAQREPQRLCFVDGVRRLEARLLARAGDVVCHGAFGSCAVGCAEMRPVPRICDEVVERVIALGSGQFVPEPIDVTPLLRYVPATSMSADPDGPLLAIQATMRSVEEDIARRLAAAPDALVVTDGPLTFTDPTRGATVGFIKRLHEFYLPDTRILRQLQPGQRTPLFAIFASQRFSRFAWFVRLAAAGPADYDLAGLARLEVSTAVGIDDACALADLTALLLPRFAPPRARDPRSPQNLLPIGALESALRRRMGDARLVRRQIESHLVAEKRSAHEPAAN